MGSHSARHRPARRRADRPEERATALLARLGAAAPASTPTRHAARPATGPLDPFSTAPFPARPARPAEQAASGGTRCSGARTAVLDEAPAPVNPVGVPLALPAPRRALDDDLAVEPRDDAPPGVEADAPRAVEETAPWSFAEALAAPPATPLPPADAPAGLSPDDVPAVPPRSIGRRVQPIVAALSVTAVGATALLVAAGTDNKAPDTADATTTLGTAPAGTLSFALPSADPATPEPVTGPASVLAPDQQPVQVSAIVAQAVADARTVADKQAADQKATADKAAAKAAADKAAAIRTSAAAKARGAAPANAPGGGSSAGAASAAAAAPAGSSVAARALAAAKTRLGKPYVWGAAGPNSFDCSGLVLWAFKQVGISLPHSSSTQSTMGTAVSKADLQPGDLVFFYTPVSHVGFYLGNGQILHASQSGEPVKITDMKYMPFHNARRITG